MQHDDALRDNIAVFALGALPEAEARILADHLATCEACRREYADIRAAANSVGYTAELVPGAVDDLGARRLKARVMDAVFATQRDLPAGNARPAAPVTAVSRGRGWWLPYGAAAAAILVAAMSLANNASLRAERANDAARVAALRAQRASDATRVASLETKARDANARARELAARLGMLGVRVAQLVGPGSRHFAVPSGEVVESGNRIVIALHHLPKLKSGKVYQVWALARGKKIAAPSVTFVPDGAGMAVVQLPERAAKLAAVAVTIEPAGGSKAPTTKPAFVRALT